MAMIRACSYTATIQAPEDPTNYESILITFAQDGSVKLEKDETEVTFDDNKIIVQLNQEETKSFACGKKAYLQIRCFKSEYAAHGSMIWAIDVWPALDDQILPPEEDET